MHDESFISPGILLTAAYTLYGREWKSVLSAKLGVSRRTLSRWRTGETQPPRDLCEKLLVLVESKQGALKRVHHVLEVERDRLQLANDEARA